MYSVLTGYLSLFQACQSGQPGGGGNNDGKARFKMKKQQQQRRSTDDSAKTKTSSSSSSSSKKKWIRRLLTLARYNKKAKSTSPLDFEFDSNDLDYYYRNYSSSTANVALAVASMAAQKQQHQQQQSRSSDEDTKTKTEDINVDSPEQEKNNRKESRELGKLVSEKANNLSVYLKSRIKYPSVLKRRQQREEEEQSEENQQQQQQQRQEDAFARTTLSRSRSSGVSTSGGGGGGVRMTAQMASFLKLTLVGDGGVGKFVEEYEPTKADAYRRTITLQGDEVQIDILDTAGQEDYPAVRDGYLKHGDGFLLVFDLTNRETFESIKNHRENVLRVKGDDPGLPIILIGNKCDLSNRRITAEEAQALANRWNIPYIETSAKTRENVDKAFSEIFVRIKELKHIRRANPVPVNPQSVLTPQEEDAVRKDSKKKRIKKFFQNLKKGCKMS